MISASGANHLARSGLVKPKASLADFLLREQVALCAWKLHKNFLLWRKALTMEDLKPYDTVCGLSNVRPTKDRNKCKRNESKQHVNTWQITEVLDSTKQHRDEGVRSPQSLFYTDRENRYKRWLFRWYICETRCFYVLLAIADKVISLWLLILVSLKRYAYDKKISSGS